MIRSTVFKLTTACLFLMIVAVGCGDNSTGTEPEGEPPEIPEITAAQPDFSYFSQTKEKSKLLDDHAFSNAQNTALTAQGLFAFGQFYNFFGMSENEEPEFEDGQWVWNYSITSGGETLEFKLVAMHEATETINGTEVDRIHWEFYISATGEEFELEDFKYMEGTTWSGMKGDWTVYDYSEDGSSNRLMSYEWIFDNDENLSATFNFHDEDTISSIEYVQDGTAHTLTMNSTTDLEVYWDTAEDHGYWWDKGSNEKLCWTSDKSTIACSDIGL